MRYETGSIFVWIQLYLFEYSYILKAFTEIGAAKITSVLEIP